MKVTDSSALDEIEVAGAISAAGIAVIKDHDRCKYVDSRRHNLTTKKWRLGQHLKALFECVGEMVRLTIIDRQIRRELSKSAFERPNGPRRWPQDRKPAIAGKRLEVLHLARVRATERLNKNPTHAAGGKLGIVRHPITYCGVIFRPACELTDIQGVVTQIVAPPRSIRCASGDAPRVSRRN